MYKTKTKMSKFFIKIGYIWLSVNDITYSLYKGEKRIIKPKEDE